MSRILTAEQLENVAPWQAPDVGAPAPRQESGPAVGGGLVTAGVLEDLQQEAYREAFQQGLREGFTAGQEQARAQVERLDQLLSDLARPFEELDGQVQQELLALGMALAKQIVRRELRQDPTQIIGIVREAIGALPVAARDVRVQLYPEDAALVRQYLAPTESERAWVIVEDPMMMRGGCQVTTATSRIDARLETRLGAILSELMGGERTTEARGERG